MEQKKLAIMRINQILLDESDEKHPLTQAKIGELLEKKYGIELERKAIGNTIQLLQDMYDMDSLGSSVRGVTLVSKKKTGVYIENRLFEDSELRLLIDSVLASRHIAPKYTKDIVTKLCTLSNKYFKSNMKNIYSVNEWNKSENKELFCNIDAIDTAISKNKKIKFDYYKYDKKKEFIKSSEHVASPYQLILHNQRYYLMFYSEKHGRISYFRVDRIKNIEILSDVRVDLRSLEGYKNGVDYKYISTSLPYMFTDKPERITFLSSETAVNDVIDWFGLDVKIEPYDETRVKVSLNSSCKAMEYWAMQYMNSVEVISPVSLRDKIKENIKNAREKYSK